MDININTFISFLISPEIQQKLFLVRISFFSIGAILLIAIIVLILNTHYYQWLFVQDFWEFLTFRPFGAKKITRIWNKIVRRLDAGLESEYKLAIIEADDMLDTSLKRMGYMGQTIEEKLEKLTAATLTNIQDVYTAHKIRNNIVHNPDYRLGLEEARSTIDIYEKAFNSLQILT